MGQGCHRQLHQVIFSIQGIMISTNIQEACEGRHGCDAEAGAFRVSLKVFFRLLLFVFTDQL